MNSNTHESQPFLLNLIKPLKPRLIAEALEQKEVMKSTYNPVIQTSDSVMLAGTSLTYCDTGIFNTDTEQCDT